MFVALLLVLSCRATTAAPSIRSKVQSRGPQSGVSWTDTALPRTNFTVSDVGNNATFTPVVGCGSVVDRREIDDLQQNHADVFNIFLLALENLQVMDESDALSYYGLAGIHGYPFQPWQEDADFVPATPGRGYCSHASSIFTTWHRPYLALVEQLLCTQARAIAQQFTGADAARYQAAAEEVRLPYWDWASSSTQSHVPSSVQQASISVNKPSGQETITNPLYTYHFHVPPPGNSVGGLPGWTAGTVC